MTQSRPSRSLLPPKNQPLHKSKSSNTLQNPQTQPQSTQTQVYNTQRSPKISREGRRRWPDDPKRAPKLTVMIMNHRSTPKAVKGTLKPNHLHPPTTQTQPKSSQMSRNPNFKPGWWQRCCAGVGNRRPAATNQNQTQPSFSILTIWFNPKQQKLFMIASHDPIQANKPPHRSRISTFTPHPLRGFGPHPKRLNPKP